MPITEDQLRHLSARLSMRRAELLAEIDAHKTHRSDGATHLRTHRGETDDDAVVDTLDAMEIRSLARSQSELASVDAALDRVARGDYGVCRGCGAELPQARLEAAPDAPLCIDCQSMAERRH